MTTHTEPQAPIIILGMERSGTTMLVRLLEQLGWFSGARKESNHEALFFWRINRWIFREVNATWDNPYNFRFTDSQAFHEMVRVIGSHLGSWRAIEYLGLAPYLRYRHIRQIDFPWGWKDPKNTFTAPIWAELFPQAKFIHIYRNPIDVGQSLYSRLERQRKAFRRTLMVRLKENLLIMRVPYVNSHRLLDAQERVCLWEAYVSRAFALEQQLDNAILHVKYEDFLERPEEQLNVILQFIQLEAPAPRLKQICQGVNPAKRYAFLNDQRLIDLYHEVKQNEWIQKLGYGSLGHPVL